MFVQEAETVFNSVELAEDGKIFNFKKRTFAAISLLSYSYLSFLHYSTSEYLSVSNYRLLSFSNEDPPTTIYLIASVGLISFLLLLREEIETFMNRQNVWYIFSTIHSNIYTLFLWHVAVFFFTSYFSTPVYLYLLIIFVSIFVFGNYERKTFRLSRSLIKRVNPLQPWPTPIKARLSYSNFLLAWISSVLVIIGIFQITLGGVGLSGFFSLRPLYIFSGNTFEAFIRIIIGLLLLNVTVRRVDLKNQLLVLAIASQVVTLLIRFQLYSSITSLELYLGVFLVFFYLILIFNIRNYKSLV